MRVQKLAKIKVVNNNNTYTLIGICIRIIYADGRGAQTICPS